MSKFHFDMEPVLLIYFSSWDITPRFSPKVTHLLSNPLSIRKTNKQNKQKPCLKKKSDCCYGYSQHSKQFSHPRRCLWWETQNWGGAQQTDLTSCSNTELIPHIHSPWWQWESLPVLSTVPGNLCALTVPGDWLSILSYCWVQWDEGNSALGSRMPTTWLG